MKGSPDFISTPGCPANDFSFYPFVSRLNPPASCCADCGGGGCGTNVAGGPWTNTPCYSLLGKNLHAYICEGPTYYVSAWQRNWSPIGWEFDSQVGPTTPLVIPAGTFKPRISVRLPSEMKRGKRYDVNYVGTDTQGNSMYGSWQFYYMNKQEQKVVLLSGTGAISGVLSNWVPNVPVILMTQMDGKACTFSALTKTTVIKMELSPELERNAIACGGSSAPSPSSLDISDNPGSSGAGQGNSRRPEMGTNPIYLATGRKTEFVNDISFGTVGGQVAVGRTYNSLARFGDFGFGWRSTFQANIAPSVATATSLLSFQDQCDPSDPNGNLLIGDPDLTQVDLNSLKLQPYASGGGLVPGMVYVDPSGSEQFFVYLSGPGGSSGCPGSGILNSTQQNQDTIFMPFDKTINASIRVKPDNTSALVFLDGSYKMFDSTGLITADVDANGNTLAYVRTDSSDETISAPGGRSVQIHRNANGVVDQITDPMGQIYTYTYDTNDNLISVDGPGAGGGYHATYTYDDQHQLIAKNDPKGQGFHNGHYVYQNNRVVQEYDGLNRLRYSIGYQTDSNNNIVQATVTDARGQSTSQQFDADGRVLLTVDAGGTKTENQYDSNGNLSKRIATAPDGTTHKQSWTYDSSNNLLSTEDAEGNDDHYTYGNLGSSCACAIKPTSYKDKRGNTTYYKYDSFGNLTQTTDALQNNTYQAYDNYGELVSTTDAKGNIITYIYNASGDQTDIQSPAGTTHYDYDGLGRVIAVTDELGHKTTYELDGVGNRVVTHYPDNTFVKKDFDAQGRLTTVWVRTEEGNSPEADTIYSYDAADEISSITDPTDKATQYAYDGDSNRISITDAGGKVWQTSFDLLNRPVVQTNPLAQGTTTGYDGFGNRVKVTDANGNATQYQYDRNNRLRYVTDALSHTNEFRYDENGNLVKFIDANGLTTKYQYDARNQQTDEIDAKSVTVKHLVYDANGNVQTMTDGRGITTTYAYDAANRMTSESPSQGNGYNYAYGQKGQENRGYLLHTATDGGGTETFDYDGANRLQTQTKPGGQVINYEYDEHGNRIGSTLNLNGTQFSQAWAYDLAGRNVTSIDFAGNTKTLQYDQAGRLSIETMPGGTTANYQYDDANRLLELRNKNQFNAALSFSRYTLDAVGNRIDRTDAAGTYTFSFDKIYQLTGVKTQWAGVQETATYHLAPGVTTTAAWAYDAMGNRSSYTEAYAGNTSGLNKTYSYDDANEMTADGNINQGFDGNGNLTSRSGETLTWDNHNRLIADVKGNTNWAATYSFNNRISSKTLGGVVTNFIYDDRGHLLAEVDASGTPLRLYSYDGIGLSTIHVVSNGRLGTAYPLFDGLGSIVALVDQYGKKNTDYVDYGEWGQENWPGGDSENPFRYTGRWGGYTDDANGRVLDWFRWYDAEEGRWESRDPIASWVSRKAYIAMNNSPLNFIDPKGLYPRQVCEQNFVQCLLYGPNSANLEVSKGLANQQAQIAASEAQRLGSQLKCPNKSSNYRYLAAQAESFGRLGRIAKALGLVALIYDAYTGWECAGEFETCLNTGNEL
jgi:RHS repeat-associated protein